MWQFISIHRENKGVLKHNTFYFEGMMKCTWLLWKDKIFGLILILIILILPTLMYRYWFLLDISDTIRSTNLGNNAIVNIFKRGRNSKCLFVACFFIGTHKNIAIRLWECEIILFLILKFPARIFHMRIVKKKCF